MSDTQNGERETPEHLQGVEDGGGCAEVWDAISEALADEDREE